MPWVNSANGTTIDSDVFPVMVVVALLFFPSWFKSTVAFVSPESDQPLGRLELVVKSSVVLFEPPGKVKLMILPGCVIKSEVPFELAELKPL